DCRAVFSADSKYLLCASGDYIKVYSTLTEECLHILQGHSNLVTGIQLNPQNHLQLYSWSLDGTIKLWDFMDGILIKTFVVGSKLFAFYTLASSENSAFIIISKHEKSDKFQLMTVKLPKTPDQEVEANDLEMVLDGVSQSPKCTAFGRDGEYVVSVWKLHLVVCFFKKSKSYSFSIGKNLRNPSTSHFTCIACHPKEDCIASGHKDGKIRLWRNFNHKREYTFSTMHWHHNEVIDLAFSVEEIVIIHSNLKVSAVIQGLIKGSDVKTGLIVDPRTKALVLNGKPGHLQFYSLQNDKLLYNLDVVQQEYIHQWGLNQIELVKAVFDSKGNWLATVEQRQGSGCELEMQLKLWAYNEQTQSFTLNTRINTPHEDCITAVCFRGTDHSENVTPTLVTTSNDGHFKVWMLLVDKDNERACALGGLFVPNISLAPPAVAFLEWSAQLHVNVLQPDHLSENIAAISQHSEYSDVFVFRPSEPRPLCIQRNVCKGKVQWAVFVPRDVPECIASEKYQWLSQSQFYFLTETHELMTFSTKTPEERLTPSSRQLAVEESISMTPFYLLLGKHRQQMKEGMDTGKAPVQNLLGQESPAVKELLHTPAHVLPSASFLCPLFIHSLLVPRTSTNEIAEEVEMLSDSEEKESEEESEVIEIRPEASQTTECFGEGVSKLSKLQERDLRKLRKMDYSWASEL
ncbi:WD repeat-containing protein 75, partial [Ophiophagus hannah]